MPILYVYDMNIIDWFQGMTQIKDYYKLCENNTLDAEFTFYLSPAGLRNFMAICFTALANSPYPWEHDVRGSNIAIGAIPSCDNQSPYKFIALKQDNNGLSFLISEIPINFIRKNENPECTPIQVKKIDDWNDLINNLLT